jgi:glycosyltransferase involved in cell wall biosynthesis
MADRLSILHTEASVGWGGQELRILTEARGLIARGHEVRVACPPEATIFREAPRFGVPVVALPLRRVNPRSILAMRKLLAASRPQVVNTHSSVDSWAVALASRLVRGAAPVVRTRHVSIGINKSPGTLWLYRRACARVVTAGERLRRQLIETAGLDPARTVSVPTGVDSTRFVPGDRAAARRALGLPPAAFAAGVVATLRIGKGHRFLLEAWSRLQDRDARLLVVGSGPQEEALRAQVAALGLGERVVLAGNQDDVVPWLQAMDLFVLPSLHEGVPQVIVQAQMCGVPVVATNVGGIPEAVADGVTGVLVPPEDVEALRGAIASLAQDAGRRRALGAAARDAAVRRFDLRVMLDAMERLFREVADGR